MGRGTGFKNTQDNQDDDLPWYIFGAARRAALSAKKAKRSPPVMGSDKNVDAGLGRGTVPMPPPEQAPKRTEKPSVKRKPAGEYVAPSSPESAQTAGIKGLPGAQSGMSEEEGSRYGKESYFGEAPEDAVATASQMRKGLFGEPISQEDWDAMTARNKQSSFWGQFKKGGAVKKKPTKKYAKGGSVSSASKRGDGCAQRGKTKGRMV